MVAFLKPSWWPPRWRRSAGAGDADGDDPLRQGQDPLPAMGQRLRQAREARGLNLRQLALETRISTAVLEALERGWRDRLPEPAYLRTMLPLLERHLQLERGSLRAALPEALPTQMLVERTASRRSMVSIELFTSWHGTALYALLMLALLYALNLEQRRLASQGLLALHPIPPMGEAAQQRLPSHGEDQLIRVHPELSPLTLARRGQALALLQRQPLRLANTTERGVLSLTLTSATRLTLTAGDGLRTAVQVGPGELALSLTTPLQLSLQPAPAVETAVQWNGMPLPAEAPGRYRWPRPQSTPRSEPTPRPERAASSP